jgi:hypothetical protein
MKLYSSILTILFCALSACAIHHNGDDTAFAYADQLKALTGTYQNRSESSKGPDPFPQYLSRILWADEDLEAHQSIDKIRVKLVDQNTLQADALAVDGQALKSSQFVRGKHFQIRNGQLEINVQNEVAGMRSGEVLVGAHQKSTLLGLDTKGNGKVRKKESSTGLVFLFLPVHLGQEIDTRFVKLE